MWVELPASRCALAGFVFGLGLYGVGISWIYISLHEFGGAHPALAIALVFTLAIVLSLFIAIVGYIQAKIPASARWRFLLLLPALWVFVEWIRSWAFTGFPWLYAGYTQTDSWLGSFAPVFGVYGSSFVVCFIAGLIALLSIEGIKSKYCYSFLAAVLVVSFALDQADWIDTHEQPIRVSIIQGDINIADKWNANEVHKHLTFYVNESRNQVNSDLVIWPEIALPYTTSKLEKLRLWKLLSDLPQDYLLGALEDKETNEGPIYYNSAIGITDKSSVQVYRKKHLVPFGEFTPFRKLLGWLESYILIPASDMLRYELPQNPLRLAGQLAGISICYEDAFSSSVRSMLPEASYLINISEDAWFGTRLAPHQRLQISKMRAIETARPVLRAANQGISAAINHQGKIIDQLPQSQGKVLQTVIVPVTGTTPYVAFGVFPILTICIIGIAIPLLRRYY